MAGLQEADAGLWPLPGGGVHDALHLLPIHALAGFAFGLVLRLLAVELGEILAQLAAARGGVEAVAVAVLPARRQQGDRQAVAMAMLDPPQFALAVERHPIAAQRPLERTHLHSG